MKNLLRQKERKEAGRFKLEFAKLRSANIVKKSLKLEHPLNLLETFSRLLPDVFSTSSRLLLDCKL